MFSRLFLVAALLAVIALGSSIPLKRASVCNGRAELCPRSYGNVTFLGSHDSYAFSENPLALARTQEVDIPSQLKVGVRFLQAQSHMRPYIWLTDKAPRCRKNGELHFCHTSCLLFDGGSVVDYLKNVKPFLDENPNEVVTLLFTNPEGVSPHSVWKPAFDDSGLTPFAYVPPHQPMKRSEWPTLGELIDSGKRIIVFLDAGADKDSENFILPEFTMVWEPPFDSTDPSFPCKVDRSGEPLTPAEQLYMLNHNLDKKVVGDILISDRSDAPTTNSVNSIMADANGCEPLADGLPPNFVMLDYVNVGEGMKAVDQLNGFS